jgi:hypothetical protein
MNSLKMLFVVLGLGVSVGVAAGQGPVIVNGVSLDESAIEMLDWRYGIRTVPGRYWYDRISGAWGLEGGPAMGQIRAGLAIGGPLRANASGGRTGVFVNGRELHLQEVLALRQCTVVIPGHYWVNAYGIGGLEGGPPMFNLAALCRQAGGRNFGSRTWYGSNGSWSHHSDATGLGVISDGQSVIITGR